MAIYRCECCGGEFEQGWSDAEAEAELASIFGVPTDDCAVVCDDCYTKSMAALTAMLNRASGRC